MSGSRDTFQFEEKTIRCQYADHQQKDIQGACIHNKCQEYRLYCNICMKQSHADHVNELLDFADLSQWLVKQAALQQQLKNLINEIYFLYQVLFDFCSPSLIEPDLSLSGLTATQLNEKVNLAIRFSSLDPQFYQNLKICSSFLQDFKNQVKGFMASDCKDHQVLYKKYFETTVPQPSKHLDKTFKIPLTFSTALKPKEILVSTKGNTAKNNGFIGFILCEPQIPQQGVSKFAFKILKCSSGPGIGFGVCHKDLLINSRFRPDLRFNGHGVYLLDKAGWLYSHIDKENNCKRTNMSLNVNDIIIIEVDANKSKIIWTKKSTNEQICLNIDMGTPLYSCVELAWGQIEIQQL